MKKFSSIISLVFLMVFYNCKNNKASIPDIAPNTIVPSQQQLDYQKMEMVGFVHFTVNTFTDKEWGYGDEDPAIFNPTELNAEQWAKTAKEAGLKELILTAKHHDGFCLWPSKYTEHSVKNSPYKNGQGDIVREFVNACKKYGLKVGLYLSPWDRNHADYGKPAYIEYYRNQLRELLTEYGEINEIWFDGANGGDGYYGGAKEERRIDRETYYDWKNTFALVKELQPNILIFSDAGPDIRWVGNEHGHAGETFWSTIQKDSLVIGGNMADYLNIGESAGNAWIVGQCDVSIRPGWFYHQSQDSLVKTKEELFDIYQKSVGRNGVLLINLPPTQQGLFHETDVKNLLELKNTIDHSFSKNLAQNALVTASNVRGENEKFTPKNVIDSKLETYWATDDKVEESYLTLTFSEEKKFNTVLLQEPIQLGQRIEAFEIQVFKDNEWKTAAKGTTVGYKRLVKLDDHTGNKVQIKIIRANNTTALSTVKIYNIE